jgi:uncharacterized paraquat-inducible protein A
VNAATSEPLTRTTQTSDPATAGAGVAVRESCPLCGAALGAAQEWCLSCGAAARTRLAATPRWRAPLLVLGVVIVLAAGVLTAALVSLAG